MNEQSSEQQMNAASQNERADSETADRTVNLNPANRGMGDEAAPTEERPRGETLVRETPAGTDGGSSVPLLGRKEGEDLRMRWHEIQGKFVDDPRYAVQQADGLVSEAIEQIVQVFARERGALESQWKQSNNVSTEDLRQALQHYRSFFNRLVG